MNFLLDTDVLLWAVAWSARLDRATRSLLEEEAGEVLFSAASIWEIAIKASLRRADFNADPEAIARGARAMGFRELPVHSDAATRVAGLPSYHRDPFDRLLVAQAITTPARLLTADVQLERYTDLITLVKGLPV